MLLRNEWAVLAVWVVALALTRVGSLPQGNAAWTVGPIFVIEWLLYYVVLKRYGLVAAIAMTFVWRIFVDFQMTFQASAWYAGYGYAALAVVAAIVLHGFRTSLGGRPLLNAPGVDD